MTRISLSLMALMLMMFGGSALYGDTLNYTFIDTNNKWSMNGSIDYSLTVDLGSNRNTGTATFVMIPSGNTLSPNYYAGEFDFKFSAGNVTPTLFGLTWNGTGSWVELDKDYSKDVYKDGKKFNALSASAAGFALSGIIFDDSPPSPAEYQLGIRTNSSSPATFSFNFDLGQNKDGSLISFREDAIPFQAIFFGSDGKYAGQLSETLVDPPTVQNPEPTSLVLLGTGIAALGFAAWRKRR